MKKLIFRCLTLAGLLAAGACGDGDEKGTVPSPPQPKESFVIGLGEPTAVSVEMTVTPADNEASYYYDVLPKAVLDEHHTGDLAVYMKNMMAEAVKNLGSVEEALGQLTEQGVQHYNFQRLTPDTEYWAFAAGLDEQGEVNTGIVKSEFRTRALGTDEVAFSVEFDKVAYDGFDFTITPTDLDFPYYYCTRPAFAYRDLTDQELLDAILMEDSFMLDWYAAPGVQTYESEQVCATDTEYWVLIFGYANGSATTGIYKYPQRTAKPATDPAACRYDITWSGLTSRSVNVKVRPSDETVMYMFDLIADADYQAVRNDMKGYVTEYVADDLSNLDYNRLRGEQGYSFTKILDPATTYYVWVAAIDEFGLPQGEVRISDPIVTLAHVESDAVVTATHKYFNGDDLYARDPVKYADCKGLAYVEVNFAAEKSTVWYGNLVEEDPSDPTSAMSDAEIAQGLMDGGGSWCPTGKLYLCKWDREHTILAVGIGADENAGKVLRETLVFTKAGASPVSEFVDPEARAAACGKAATTHTASVRRYKR